MSAGDDFPHVAREPSEWEDPSTMYLEIPPEFAMTQGHDADGTVRLMLSGELDMAVAPRLEARLRQLQMAHSPVRLDLSELGFIDSTGLRAILMAQRQSDQNGWRFEVDRNVAPTVERLFKLAQVDGLLWR